MDEAIARYGARLYGLCLKLCANPYDAQDLYQDTWLKAYRARHRFDPARDYGVWLTRICVNTHRDHLRRGRLYRLLHVTRGDPEPLLMAAPAPESAESSEVREAVDALPEPLRRVVLLYYYHDCDIAHTAQALGIPPGTVKSRLSKARALLKGRLMEDG